MKSDLHEPVEVVVDRSGIGVVDFDDWREFFGGHQNLVFVEHCAREIHAPVRSSNIIQLH